VRNTAPDRGYDLFVNHAYADKNPFVLRLVRRLQEEITVWYDDDILKGGDPLLESLNEGMRQSRHAIVVFSKAFLKKKRGLRDHEYHVLLSRQISQHEQNLIIPILYGVTSRQVSAYDATLGDRYQLDYTKLRTRGLIREILRVVKPQKQPVPEESVEFIDSWIDIRRRIR
jgi:hypothetical protein